MARLTWKSAFRYRIFWVMAVTLAVAVVGLPMVLKDDGTAKGLTQIVLTYTLSAVSVALGIATLWLSCGTLARDVEDCQIQMVVSKPIGRWQVWLGKWLGILALNAMLLVLAGAAIFFLLQWRSHRLPADQQTVLHNEIFVARAAMRMRPPDLSKSIEAAAAQWRKNNPSAKPSADEMVVLNSQWAGEARADLERVEPYPGGPPRVWEINCSSLPAKMRTEPMQMRVKFNVTADTNAVAALNNATTYRTVWRIGPPSSQQPQILEESLPPNSYQELPLSPLLDPKGNLYVVLFNVDDTALYFPIEDGFEVLYRESTFAVNFARGMAVILCWLALLSAIGLASASFFSFPVAAFCSLAVLLVGLSTGTLSEVQREKSLFFGDSQKPPLVARMIDSVVVPVLGAALKVVNLVESFSPVDSLSTGHSITWGQLGAAAGQIVLLMGGLFSAAGILLFHRRELAATQVNS